MRIANIKLFHPKCIGSKLGLAYYCLKFVQLRAPEFLNIAMCFGDHFCNWKAHEILTSHLLRLESAKLCILMSLLDT